MEFLAKAGFASPYFITDSNRVINSMSEPAVLASVDEMTLELLACGIGELALSQKKDKFARENATLGYDAARQALDEIIDGRSPSEHLVLRHPLLILTHRLDKAALAPLLIMKMRGWVQTLAVRFSTPDEVIVALDVFTKCAKPKPNGGTVIVFDGIRNLSVVSGRYATVFSTDTNCDGILKNHPDIASDKPLTEEEYSFFE